MSTTITIEDKFTKHSVTLEIQKTGNKFEDGRPQLVITQDWSDIPENIEKYATDEFKTAVYRAFQAFGIGNKVDG